MAYQVVQGHKRGRTGRLAGALARGFGGYREQQLINDAKEEERWKIQQEIAQRDRTSNKALFGALYPHINKTAGFPQEQYDRFVKQRGTEIRANSEALEKKWGLPAGSLAHLGDADLIARFGRQDEKAQVLKYGPPELRQEVDQALMNEGRYISDAMQDAYNFAGDAAYMEPEQQVEMAGAKLKELERAAAAFVRGKKDNTYTALIDASGNRKIEKGYNDVAKEYRTILNNNGYGWMVDEKTGEGKIYTLPEIQAERERREADKGPDGTGKATMQQATRYLPTWGVPDLEPETPMQLGKDAVDVMNAVLRPSGPFDFGKRLDAARQPFMEEGNTVEAVRKFLEPVAESTAPPVDRSADDILGLDTRTPAAMQSKAGIGTELRRASRVSEGAGQGVTEIVLSAGQRHGVDPQMILAVIDQETGGQWNEGATGELGETGLMQLLKNGALAQYNKEKREGQPPITPEQSYDPEVNIEIGTWYLRWVREHLGPDATQKQILHGYNGGVGNVLGGTVSPEAQGYADSVMRRAPGFSGIGR